MVWQISSRIQRQWPRVFDDLQIAALAGFAQIGHAALDLGYVERVVDPHEFGMRRLGQADRGQGRVQTFLVGRIIERLHGAGWMAAGEAVDPRDLYVHLFDAACAAKFRHTDASRIAMRRFGQIAN